MGELEAMTRHTKSKIEAIKPDQQDFDAVEKEYGPLPLNASQAALAGAKAQLSFVTELGRSGAEKLKSSRSLRHSAFLHQQPQHGPHNQGG